MNKNDYISVTRWLNPEQKFVHVGVLFRDDSLNKANPIVGFKYDSDYLAKYPSLLPESFEDNFNEGTIIGDTDYNSLIPSYFKQFLPSEKNKSVFRVIDSEYLEKDQFQQVQHITKFKSALGAIQLDYDNGNDNKFNVSTDMSEAISLLEQVCKGDYASVDEKGLNALYHPNSDTHAVSSFIEINKKFFHCTIKPASDETSVNKQLMYRHIMNACGVECSITMKLEKNSEFYFGQTTGEQVVDFENNNHLMYNTVPVSALVSDSRKTSHYEPVTYKLINETLNDAIDVKDNAQLLKRALFAHLFKQKNMTVQHIKIKDLGEGRWRLSPQEILEPVYDANIPFKLPFSATVSAYDDLVFDVSFINMMVTNFELTKNEVHEVLGQMEKVLDNIVIHASQFDLSMADIENEIAAINKSELKDYLKKSKPEESVIEDKDNGPLL